QPRARPARRDAPSSSARTADRSHRPCRTPGLRPSWRRAGGRRRSRARGSLRRGLELDVLVGRGVREAGDEAEARFGHARPMAVQERGLEERNEQRAVVHGLLELDQDRLAPLLVSLARLLLEESVEVGIATPHEAY